MIDIYEPRAMGAALEEAKIPRRFLRDTFFSTQTEYETEHVDIDTEEGVRKMAPFSNPEGPGKVVERNGFTTETVTPPLVAPKRPITAKDISTRLPGEHLYQRTDPSARARILLGKDLRELDDMIARREEWMCSKVLFESQITVSGDDVGSYVIEFARDASLTITLAGATLWTASTGKPIDNVEDWAELVVKLSGATTNFMVLGADAWKAMRGNTQVKEQLDLLRVEAGRLAPAMPGQNGARFVGEFAGTGIPMFTYSEWYVDPADGVQKPMVPVDKILLGSTEFRTEMRYGGVKTMSGAGDDRMPAVVAGARVPRSWIGEDPPIRWVQLKSRPLPVPVQNRFLVAKVV